MFKLPTLHFPRFSSRFFLYFLFGLVILILAVEGGYYFWIQKRMARQQTKNPLIAREEGVFSYVKLPDGTTQKVILGTIKEINGNLLTIKTDNNKTAQVLFTGEKTASIDLTSGLGDYRFGSINDLLIGDKVTVADTYADKEGKIGAKSLTIVKGINK
ncbi:MAG: hypothetical protein LiPW31_104 [Microgenomates group bacterium LiPW_31]|nr:MAG: hypothetical protein LiPW31_104 [Microgenomates group bacterium LiPW_31]